VSADNGATFNAYPTPAYLDDIHISPSDAKMFLATSFITPKQADDDDYVSCRFF
jgi:hypothetical protein